jgi:hypothetical protein
MPRRRTAIAQSVAVAVAVAGAVAGLWWLHGKSTIVTDWSEVARCQSPANVDQRVTRSLDPATCRSGFVVAPGTTVERGDAVVAVVLGGGVGDVPAVASLSSDRAGRRVRVTSRVLSSTPARGKGREAMWVGTLVFVELPARELPPTPFTLVDDLGESEVRSAGP